MTRAIAILEELVAADQASSSGVYCILNLSNNKRYVGSTTGRIIDRIRQHSNALRARRHSNRHLQGAWNKYGSKAFMFIILKNCVPDRVTELEQEYIDSYGSWKRDLGYNLSPSAGNTFGVIKSEETRRKISIGNTGKKASEETKRKMSLRRKGVMHSQEHQEAVNKALRSPEIRAKIAAGLKGKKKSPEHVAKATEAMRKARYG